MTMSGTESLTTKKLDEHNDSSGRDKDGKHEIFLEIPRAHTFLPVTALAEVAARRTVRAIRGEVFRL